jgi:hypothetical protein
MVLCNCIRWVRVLEDRYRHGDSGYTSIKSSSGPVEAIVVHATAWIPSCCGCHGGPAGGIIKVVFYLPGRAGGLSLKGVSAHLESLECSTYVMEVGPDLDNFTQTVR